MTNVLDKSIRKIAHYLRSVYFKEELNGCQACTSLLLSNGSELGKLLGTSKLPSLNIRDVARYIVLHT